MQRITFDKGPYGEFRANWHVVPWWKAIIPMLFGTWVSPKAVHFRGVAYIVRD